MIGHIELMLAEGEVIPQARSLDDIMELPEATACIPLMVTIIAHHQAKHSRINIRLDSALLKAIDGAVSIRHDRALLVEDAQRLLGSR